ncbi:hypothetical protein LAZ67_13000439 [Cordylochernes scorpioides]|uniref:Myb-like domain-containing protein n=1 Tax=Cordylochernes scorpioides TaxID=51811 RepID=A0ABY6L5F2_9ARAC|nr:hypothetical protein LAZ67_13000439 [Cordylochernes scorpioides]
MNSRRFKKIFAPKLPQGKPPIVKPSIANDEIPKVSRASEDSSSNGGTLESCGNLTELATISGEIVLTPTQNNSSEVFQDFPKRIEPYQTISPKSKLLVLPEARSNGSHSIVEEVPKNEPVIPPSVASVPSLQESVPEEAHKGTNSDPDNDEKSAIEVNFKIQEVTIDTPNKVLPSVNIPLPNRRLKTVHRPMINIKKTSSSVIDFKENTDNKFEATTHENGNFQVKNSDPHFIIPQTSENDHQNCSPQKYSSLATETKNPRLSRTRGEAKRRNERIDSEDDTIEEQPRKKGCSRKDKFEATTTYENGIVQNRNSDPHSISPQTSENDHQNCSPQKDSSLATETKNPRLTRTRGEAKRRNERIDSEEDTIEEQPRKKGCSRKDQFEATTHENGIVQVRNSDPHFIIPQTSENDHQNCSPQKDSSLATETKNPRLSRTRVEAKRRNERIDSEEDTIEEQPRKKGCSRKEEKPIVTLADLIRKRCKVKRQSREEVTPVVEEVTQVPCDVQPTETFNTGPQLIIRDDGEIILDQQSVYIPQSARTTLPMVHRSIKPATRGPKWTKDEMLLFYQLYSVHGPDFTTMAAFFPNRTRRQIQRRYCKERRERPDLLHMADRVAVHVLQAMIITVGRIRRLLFTEILAERERRAPQFKKLLSVLEQLEDGEERDLPSAMRPVPHSDILPVPQPLENVIFNDDDSDRQEKQADDTNFEAENIYLPPLHIKLGLMKNFVMAMDRNASRFAYLKQKCSSISNAKIKEGIFVGHQIRELLQDGNFQNILNEVEAAAWNSFRNVCKNFLGSVKVENYRDI